MPIFDYQCNGCGNIFEMLILKNSPTPACPTCQSEDLTKLLSAPIVSSHDSRRKSFYDHERRRNDQRRQQDMEHDHSHEHEDHSI